MIEIDDDLAARIQAEFGELVDQSKAEGTNPFEPQVLLEQPAPKRRGRIPFKRNPDGSYLRGEDGQPIKDYEARAVPQTTTVVTNPLPAARLTKRDEKEVAERLQNILQGISNVIGVAEEHFEMTDEEARAIAEPLSSYLIRREPVSKLAGQILDEYDLVAAATGSAAYGVRVYKDLKKERDAAKHVAANQEPIRQRISGPSPVDDGRSNNGTEEPTRQIRPIGAGHNPVMPGDGPIPGF